MPSYDFICDECGLIHEVVRSMDVISGLKIWCPECNKDNLVNGPLGLTAGPDPVWMRRIYGSAGVIFKGKDWPGQDIKRAGVDSDIQEQRRKACVLKDQGVVPQDHVIHLGSEAKDRYAKKFADKDLDKLYGKSVRNPSPPSEAS